MSSDIYSSDALGKSPGKINIEIAEKMALFEQIYIPYPRHTELHDRCDYLRQLGLATRGLPQKGVRSLAPSGSGKTTAVTAYISRVERLTPRTEEFIPIIYVPLERATTPKKLMMSILDEFGDEYSDRGNEMTLKKRAVHYFKTFETSLLIIDEVQHLDTSRSSEGQDVTDTLKRLLDSAVVPILFLGTDDALQLFTRNIQLSGRMLPPGDIPRLKQSNREDFELFVGFVTHLDRAVLEHGMMPELGRLATPEIVPPLFRVSKGVIGRVSRLFQVALEHALRRSARRIEVCDLSWAVDRWAIPQDLIDYNPFVTGG